MVQGEEEMRVANVIDLHTRVTATRTDSDSASDLDRHARVFRAEIFGDRQNW